MLVLIIVTVSSLKLFENEQMIGGAALQWFWHGRGGIWMLPAAAESELSALRRTAANAFIVQPSFAFGVSILVLLSVKYSSRRRLHVLAVSIEGILVSKASSKAVGREFECECALQTLMSRAAATAASLTRAGRDGA